MLNCGKKYWDEELSGQIHQGQRMERKMEGSRNHNHSRHPVPHSRLTGPRQQESIRLAATMPP